MQIRTGIIFENKRYFVPVLLPHLSGAGIRTLK